MKILALKPYHLSWNKSSWGDANIFIIRLVVCELKKISENISDLRHKKYR
jgi:hypothetical protein